MLTKQGDVLVVPSVAVSDADAFGNAVELVTVVPPRHEGCVTQTYTLTHAHTNTNTLTHTHTHTHTHKNTRT